jgi:ribose transport system substrate-binding protein
MKKWFSVCVLLVFTMSLILSGCGSSSGSSTSSSGSGSKGKALKIGYVVNFGSHEWYQNIIKGSEATAKEKGFEFKWADANTDLAKQISQAENLLTQGVDVLILSPVDPAGLSTIMDKAKEKKVPVISESTLISGSVTKVGIDDLQGGIKAGKWAGEYIKANFKTQANVLTIGLPALESTRARVDGFKQGLKDSGANYKIVQDVDGKGLKDQALKISTDAITAHKDINVIYGINDDSALGGTQAYQEAGLDMSKLLTIGFGVEGVAGKRALTANGSYKAGLAMFPEYVGRTMIETAEKVSKGEKITELTQTPTLVITPENLPNYYTKDGDNWKINFDSVSKLKE